MMRSRIAPTPSGFLHTGNAFNFMLTHKLVRENRGSLALRIDDLDRERTRPEYVEDVFETLNWLGIAWDEGPHDASEVPVYSQQNRTGEYFVYIEQLKSKGHLFACNCSRSILKDTLVYPGTCLHKQLPFSDDVSWRLITPQQPVLFYDALAKQDITVNLYNSMRHPVIKKRDGSAAYQVASLADDVRMKIDTIVRGKDLVESTATQLLLASFLELDTFKQVHFYHHPLLANTAGEKLSKSAGSLSIREYRKLHSKEELWREWEKWLLVNKVIG